MREGWSFFFSFFYFLCVYERDRLTRARARSGYSCNSGILSHSFNYFVFPRLYFQCVLWERPFEVVLEDLFDVLPLFAESILFLSLLLSFFYFPFHFPSPLLIPFASSHHLSSLLCFTFMVIFRFRSICFLFTLFLMCFLFLCVHYYSSSFRCSIFILSSSFPCM